MKSSKVVVMCVLSICMGGAFANMVVNGSFEDASPTGWPPGFTRVTTAYYEGPAPAGAGEAYGAAWGADGGWGTMGSSSQEIDVTALAGGLYTFSAWLSAWTNDSDYAEVTLEFFDVGDVSVGSVFFDGNDGLSEYIVGSANADGLADASVAWTLANWSLYKATGTVPVNAVKAVITLTSNSDGGNGNDSYVDLVSFTVNINGAVLISPADGQIGVPVTTDAVADTPEAITHTTLTWGSPVGYVGAEYDVYFGTTEPNYLESDYGLTLLNTGGPTTDTAIDPSPLSDLAYGTEYYWVVDSYEPNLVTQIPTLHRGSPWVFQTVVADPIPDQQPQDTAAFPMESASFTATASSVSALNYQWKKVTAAGDIDVPGATASTLIITDIEVSDEGFYFCQFTNDSGNPVNSDSALLTVKRKLVHLPLDGDTLAGAGTTIDGVGNGELEWVTGISGNAVNFTQDNADPSIFDYIKLADDANDLHFADRTDFTVSLWVKGNYASGEGADVSIISNKNWNSGANQGWVIHNGYGNGRSGWNWKAADGARKGYGLSDEENHYINDGQWHHILVSHDRDGNADFYFDGMLKNQTDIAGDGNIDAGLPTVIGTDGAEGTEWQYAFVGSVDEVEIWNYTMDRVEVATLYTDIAGGSVCVADQDNPNASSVMDFNADCKVNLLDFAAFALEWMDCNRVPVSHCEL